MLTVETTQGRGGPAALEFFTHVYPERYTPGKARGKKLLQLALRLSGNEQSIVAALAAQELRSSIDAPSYRTLLEIYREADSAAWLERVERENRVKKQQLDQNVQKAKSEAAREPIRLALRELGVFFRESGDGGLCLKTLFSAKEYSTTPQQHLEMALMVMEAGLDFARYEYAQPFAHKAEPLLTVSTPGAKPSNELMKVRVALGLSELHRGRFKSAAKSLLHVTGDLKFADVVSPEDIATYASLCALATFTRAELKELVIENAGFKSMLELVPLVKNLLHDFYSSKYGSAMKMLDSALPVLQLDSSLAEHASTIVRDIKNQAMLQCVLPYTSLKLDKMASYFEMDPKALEKEVALLISRGMIQARIDSQNRTILARRDDKRDATLNSAIQTSQEFVREGRAALLRMSLLENLVVYSPPEPPKAQGTSKAKPSMLAHLAKRDEDAMEEEA